MPVRHANATEVPLPAADNTAFRVTTSETSDSSHGTFYDMPRPIATGDHGVQPTFPPSTTSEETQTGGGRQPNISNPEHVYIIYVSGNFTLNVNGKGVRLDGDLR